MSKYTAEIRTICESKYRETYSGDLPTKVDDIITAVAPVIFDFDFPIFDENYRLVFEKNILRHFYMREIGLETYGLWKLKLEDKLMEIMPYLNRFYSMYVQDFNPMYNFNLTRLHDETTDRNENRNNDYSNTATGSTNANSKGQDLFSDTPQGALTDVQNGKYLTTANFDASESHADSNTVGTGNSKDTNVIKDINSYYETVQGLNSRFVGEAWKAFRDGFVNVDKLLFKELEVLFMQLW